MTRIKQINNITIQYNKIYNKYQCITPNKIVLEEFDTITQAEEFCENTLDYCKNIYETTFWDYYDNEFTEYCKKHNTKQKAIDHINKITQENSIFKVRLYFNNKEIKI